MKSEELSDVPVACDLTRFNSNQNKKHETLLGELLSRIQSSRELPNGFEFNLLSDSGWYVKLAEWVTLERLCCPFLSFEQGFNQAGIWLRLTGDENAKRFLEMMLDGVIKDGQVVRLVKS